VDSPKITFSQTSARIFYKKSREEKLRVIVVFMADTPSLNPAQKEAVETTKGPLLILAGAGAGKTKTLTERIVHMVTLGISPSSILAITFTNKAANEMRERVFTRLSEEPGLQLPSSSPERPFISTFHALGVHIIKENAVKLGLPRFFGIFDKGDSKQAVKRAIKELSLDPKQYDAGKILGAISRQKGLGYTLEQFETGTEGDFYQSLVAKVWAKYEKTLREEKALDFDDLLLYTASLLEDEAVRTHYQNVWQYIHIDEYQDTNGVQYTIAKRLSESSKNICVVGDIDQNIYSWRGAQIKNILNFEKDYADAKVILLEENYRSTQTILHVANEIIKKNTFRKEKNLFTKNAEGEPISLFEAFDEVSEAEFVATQSEKLIGLGERADNIAVLYRANFQSRALEEAFLSYGISYQLLGTKFFERKEVKDVLSYIRAALEPESLSDVKRVINTPSRGIGKVSILKIFEGKANELPRGTREKYLSFQRLLQNIREVALEKPASETVKYVIQETGLENELRKGNEEEQERLENMRELGTFARRYDGIPGEKGIGEFLTNAALQSDQDSLEKPTAGVKLMTIHASKGLEFDHVFITGLEEGVFPHERISESKGTEDDEEERRLFYVALTRARKKIFLSFAQTRTIFGSRQVHIPSEFIFDIPQDMIIKEEGTYGLLRKPIFSIDF
jgi:DNA helicase-2/ATP-dependent DNA helicase PcrA